MIATLTLEDLNPRSDVDTTIRTALSEAFGRIRKDASLVIVDLTTPALLAERAPDSLARGYRQRLQTPFL